MQTKQLAQDLEPQQVPSTQLPEAQVKPSAQALPFGRIWHVPLTQLFPPPGSAFPGARALQSELVFEQLDLHALLPASHWYAAQPWEDPGRHAPAPSQVGASVNPKDSDACAPSTVPETGAVHTWEPQIFPTSAVWQDPAPSHLPVLPHVVDPVAHVVVSRGAAPSAIEPQVPTLPERVQLWQAPPHVELQHTPSAVQLPLLQSVLALHACPLASLVPH